MLVPDGQDVQATELTGDGEIISQEEAHGQMVVRVPSITMERLEMDYSLTDCSLMKIDIEGGEKIVLPAIASFLRRQRPPLYLSIHWGVLTQKEIESILDLLSSIYDFTYDDSLRVLERRRVIAEKISSIVCTARPITGRQRLAAWRMVFFPASPGICSCPVPLPHFPPRRIGAPRGWTGRAR